MPDFVQLQEKLLLLHGCLLLLPRRQVPLLVVLQHRLKVQPVPQLLLLRPQKLQQNQPLHQRQPRDQPDGQRQRKLQLLEPLLNQPQRQGTKF